MIDNIITLLLLLNCFMLILSISINDTIIIKIVDKHKQNNIKLN